MHKYLRDKILASFCILKDVEYKNPKGGGSRVFFADTAFNHGSDDYIEYVTPAGAYGKFNCLDLYNVSAIECLNEIRCLAGISYVPTCDLSINLCSIGDVKGNETLFERHSETEVIMETYEANGRITSRLIEVTTPYQNLQLFTPDFLKRIKALNDIEMKKPKHTIPTVGQTHTTRTPVTDLTGRTYAAYTRFICTGQYDVSASTMDAAGNQSNININLAAQISPQTTSPYPTSADYMIDIMQKDGAIMVNGSGSSKWAGVTADIEEKQVQEPEPISEKDITPIKKVYCPYNGDLIVYDISNCRVDELCGQLTSEKFYDLIRRINDDTKFDGFEYFKCAVCELKVNGIKDGPEMENDFDALDMMKEVVATTARKINNDPNFWAKKIKPASGKVLTKGQSIPDVQDDAKPFSTKTKQNIFGGINPSNPAISALGGLTIEQITGKLLRTSGSYVNPVRAVAPPPIEKINPYKSEGFFVDPDYLPDAGCDDSNGDPNEIGLKSLRPEIEKLRKMGIFNNGSFMKK